MFHLVASRPAGTREGDFVLHSEYQLPVLNFNDSHSSIIPSLPASSPYSSQNCFPLNLGISTDQLRPHSVNAKPPAFSQFECGTGYHVFNTRDPLIAAAFEEAEARKLSPTHISGGMRSTGKLTSVDTNSLMAYFTDHRSPPADWTSDAFSKDTRAAENWALGVPEPGNLDLLSQTVGGRPPTGTVNGSRSVRIAVERESARARERAHERESFIETLVTPPRNVAQFLSLHLWQHSVHIHHTLTSLSRVQWLLSTYPLKVYEV